MGSLIVRRDGPAMTFELSNPTKANALDCVMLSELEQQISRVEADDSIRLVLLKGASGGAFSSGADIREWSKMDPDTFASGWIGRGNAIFRRFEHMSCPSIALIEGICFGGGLELALCCDLRVGTTAARLRFPEVSIGAIPGWEGGTRLQRIVGRGRALEAILLSHDIDAQTADRWNLLNFVWPEEVVTDRLAELTDRLCQMSPRAASLAKSLVIGEEDPITAYPNAARLIKASRDSEIGIRAFFDKKTAVF